jgi:hypothetical protein
MSENTPAEGQTFEQKVNSILAEAKPGEDGKLVLPEDLDEATRFSVMAEKRRRDTQAAYTTSQQRAKALEVENQELAKGWEGDVVGKLNSEQQAELEELKHEDPEAWRQRINALEQENRQAFAETRENISSKAKEESELDRRTRLLAEYNESNPSVLITDDVIDNDVPPRFTRQLANGEINFEEFLSKVSDYLGKPKVLSPGTKAPDSPNLANSSGGATPSDKAVEASISESYKTETY